MSTYYIAHQGQQQGPFSLADIESKLKLDKLFWHDYIYDSKIEDWVLLMEYPGLTKLFNESFENPIKENSKLSKEAKPDVDPLKRRIWYVLKQNHNYGPFSKMELIQMLQGKTLFEFDFVWHNGMEAWKRLSEVSEFSISEVQNAFHKEQRSQSASQGAVFFRRKHPRAKYNSQAVVHDQKKIYKSVSVEISVGGAGLIVNDAEFEIDQQVFLHFKPGQNVPAFNAVCKIISRKENLYGVQFINISVQAKSSIHEFTKSFEKKNAA